MVGGQREGAEAWPKYRNIRILWSSHCTLRFSVAVILIPQYWTNPNIRELRLSANFRQRTNERMNSPSQSHCPPAARSGAPSQKAAINPLQMGFRSDVVEIGSDSSSPSIG